MKIKLFYLLYLSNFTLSMGAQDTSMDETQLSLLVEPANGNNQLFEPENGNNPSIPNLDINDVSYINNLSNQEDNKGSILEQIYLINPTENQNFFKKNSNNSNENISNDSNLQEINSSENIVKTPETNPNIIDYEINEEILNLKNNISTLTDSYYKEYQIFNEKFTNKYHVIHDILDKLKNNKNFSINEVIYNINVLQEKSQKDQIAPLMQQYSEYLKNFEEKTKNLSEIKNFLEEFIESLNNKIFESRNYNNDTYKEIEEIYMELNKLCVEIFNDLNQSFKEILVIFQEVYDEYLISKIEYDKLLKSINCDIISVDNTIHENYFSIFNKIDNQIKNLANTLDKITIQYINHNDEYIINNIDLINTLNNELVVIENNIDHLRTNNHNIKIYYNEYIDNINFLTTEYKLYESIKSEFEILIKNNKDAFNTFIKNFFLQIPNIDPKFYSDINHQYMNINKTYENISRELQSKYEFVSNNIENFFKNINIIELNKEAVKEFINNLIKHFEEMNIYYNNTSNTEYENILEYIKDHEKIKNEDPSINNSNIDMNNISVNNTTMNLNIYNTDQILPKMSSMLTNNSNTYGFYADSPQLKFNIPYDKYGTSKVTFALKNINNTFNLEEILSKTIVNITQIANHYLNENKNLYEEDEEGNLNLINLNSIVIEIKKYYDINLNINIMDFFLELLSHINKNINDQNKILNIVIIYNDFNPDVNSLINLHTLCVKNDEIIKLCDLLHKINKKINLKLILGNITFKDKNNINDSVNYILETNKYATLLKVFINENNQYAVTNGNKNIIFNNDLLESSKETNIDINNNTNPPLLSHLKTIKLIDRYIKDLYNIKILFNFEGNINPINNFFHFLKDNTLIELNNIFLNCPEEILNKNNIVALCQIFELLKKQNKINGLHIDLTVMPDQKIQIKDKNIDENMDIYIMKSIIEICKKTHIELLILNIKNIISDQIFKLIEESKNSNLREIHINNVPSFISNYIKITEDIRNKNNDQIKIIFNNNVSNEKVLFHKKHASDTSDRILNSSIVQLN